MRPNIVPSATPSSRCRVPATEARSWAAIAANRTSASVSRWSDGSVTGRRQRRASRSETGDQRANQRRELDMNASADPCASVCVERTLNAGGV